MRSGVAPRDHRLIARPAAKHLRMLIMFALLCCTSKSISPPPSRPLHRNPPLHALPLPPYPLPLPLQPLKLLPLHLRHARQPRRHELLARRRDVPPRQPFLAQRPEGGLLHNTIGAGVGAVEVEGRAQRDGRVDDDAHRAQAVVAVRVQHQRVDEVHVAAGARRLHEASPVPRDRVRVEGPWRGGAEVEARVGAAGGVARADAFGVLVLGRGEGDVSLRWLFG